MCGMFNHLKERRGKAVRAEFGSLLASCPDQYISNFCTIGGAAEHVRVIERLLGDSKSQRILVVGVFGGRDFWGMRALGHNVIGLNLTPEPGCPETLVGNAEESWPFPDSCFDVVIAGEILEHLIRDHNALAQAYRVLSPSGKLILTVPFIHDEPDYHVRVHTPRSIQRLLTHCGFHVHRYLERPGIPFKPLLNRAINFVNLLSLIFTDRTHYRRWLEIIGDWEYDWSAKFNNLRSIAGKARVSNWGCVILAYKTALSQSYLDINEAAFRVPDAHGP